MFVRSSEVVRAGQLSAGRVVLLLVAALAVCSSQLVIAPAASAKTPKLLKKSRVVAPVQNATLSGTVSGKATCRVKFPAKTRSVRITVRGPLSAKRPKTRKLKIKGSRNATCTWKTKSFADGRYRFTATGKVRARGKYWKVAIRRNVTVKNRNTTNTTTSSATSGKDGPQFGVGNARFVARIETQWDNWLVNAGPADQAWMRQHIWGVVGHTSFFDAAIPWAPPALVYKDLYAIYRGDSATLNAHPEWVLKDASGQRMSIPWGCDATGCPQLAGDIGSPSFRNEWVAQARKLLAAGYRGLWIDDANMEMRISNSKGVEDTPIDPRTGKPMTFADWRRYLAEFLEEIRRQLPEVELVANVLWFGGSSIGRDSDQFIQRAYTAVDRLNLERGFNDDGLTNGQAPRDIWSVDAFMQFIDRMHDRGIPVTLDSAGEGVAAWEYNLSGFFLVDRGQDAVGELANKPGQWWNGWDVRLGAPTTARYRTGDGVYRRDFQTGRVLLNPPGNGTQTIQLGKPWHRISGEAVTAVTLGAGRGAVLLP